MNTITNMAQNQSQETLQLKPKLLFEIKIQEQQPQNKIQFHDVFGFNVKNFPTGTNDSVRKQQALVHIIPQPITSSDLVQISVITHYQVSKIKNQIVEEKDEKIDNNYQNQIKSFSSSDWLLARHPNSLFKIIPTKKKVQTKKTLTKILAQSPSSSCKSDKVNGQVQPKLNQVKIQDGIKNTKIQSKNKKIHKNPNFKPRKGKNQQPSAQKFIKKLSGFHYNKNYKQNRNKTLKKLAKRDLEINLQNFTEYIGKLKLQINKKFTKPQMKIKTNAKGKQIDPKKFYDLYRVHFPFPKQREFVERFYNQAFKRVYVIMWKSDQRLKRIGSIKIEGVHYDTVETDPSSEVKIQHKEMEYEKQHVTDSKAEDKRSAFVQCLDDEGKMQLDRVFDEEYYKLYDCFDWSTADEDFVAPEKESLKKRIQKFSWTED